MSLFLIIKIAENALLHKVRGKLKEHFHWFFMLIGNYFYFRTNPKFV